MRDSGFGLARDEGRGFTGSKVLKPEATLVLMGVFHAIELSVGFVSPLLIRPMIDNLDKSSLSVGLMPLCHMGDTFPTRGSFLIQMPA